MRLRSCTAEVDRVHDHESEDDGSHQDRCEDG